MTPEEFLIAFRLIERNNRILMKIKDKEIADLKKQLEEKK